MGEDEVLYDYVLSEILNYVQGEEGDQRKF